LVILCTLFLAIDHLRVE
jgi:hypothetical protein